MVTTTDQLRAAFADPNFAVSFILENNSPAVADNIRAMGVVVSTQQDIANALNAFLADGRGDLFVQALSVPVNTDSISQETLMILAEAAQASSNIAGGPTTKSANGGFDVNALFGGLATGTLFYLNQTGKPVNPTGTAANTPPAAARQDNTMTYVMIGVAVIVVVVVIIALVKAKK